MDIYFDREYVRTSVAPTTNETKHTHTSKHTHNKTTQQGLRSFLCFVFLRYEPKRRRKEEEEEDDDQDASNY